MQRNNVSCQNEIVSLRMEKSLGYLRLEADLKLNWRKRSDFGRLSWSRWGNNCGNCANPGFRRLGRSTVKKYNLKC